MNKIPNLGDQIEYMGYIIEIIDIDHNKIDKILIKKILIDIGFVLPILKINYLLLVLFKNISTSGFFDIFKFQIWL